MPDNQAQIEYWNGPGAERWVGFNAEFDRLMRPFGAAALDRLGPRPGESVLDVGCGAGDTTLSLAERVGPGGSVVGLDISEPLLALARSRAASLENARFVLGDATTERFATPFDALYSRFGVMFFADPVAAFGNLRAALRPRARMTFACWRAIEDNPWCTLALDAVVNVVSEAPEPANPDAPGPFAFADPERVRRISSAAGFEELAFEAYDGALSLSTTGVERAADTLLRIGPASRLLIGRDHALVSRAREAITAVLAAQYSGPEVTVTGAAWIVSGRAP